MNRINAAVLIGLLALAVISCSLAGKLADSGPDMTRASDLWSDVPRMDGLAPSEMELPLTMKLIMRTVLNNLWRFNKEGEDKTAATGDWIVFTLNGTPTDVQNFYTNVRMTSFAKWEASKESTCLDGKDKGIDGVLCVFQRVADSKQIGLAIIAAQDDKTKQTNVFYVRVEKDANNTTANSSTTSGKPHAKAPATSGPVSKLNGTAPYGVEQRSMPAGTDLDQLLPKQVGPYTRTLLEKSEQRGVAPTGMEVDGPSVYATYRNGDGKEIFVEFEISTKAEDAQNALDVAAEDVTESFPTDPHFGSLGTEPSYVKVADDDGAFFAWTRGGYFFSANAKSGEADLDAFMNAFPY